MYGLRQMPTGGAFNTGRVAAAAWFDGAADYLSRTQVATVNDNSKWIYSVWFQRTETGVAHALLEAYSTGTNYSVLYITTANQIRFYTITSAVDYGGDFAPLIRDPGWYHLVLSVDTDDATAANRFRAWLNGVEVSNNFTYGTPPSAYATFINSDSQPLQISKSDDFTAYVQGSMAQATLLDGVSIQNGDYAISDFGEEFTIGANGSRWAARADADLVALADAEGGNSFCLTSAIGDGTDASSNSNDFTANSMTHAANGITHTPSAVAAIFNAQDKSTNPKVLEGGLVAKGSGGSVWGAIRSSLFVNSGKWYFEFDLVVEDVNESAIVGVGHEFNYPRNDYWYNGSYSGHDVHGILDSGKYVSKGASASYGGGITAGDVIGVALDLDNNAIWFSINGTWQNSATESEIEAGTTTNAAATGIADGYWAPAACLWGDSEVKLVTETDNLTHTAPDGFNPLVINSLTAPAHHGRDCFNAVGYTGDASYPRAVTGVGFQPDLAWLKNRDQAYNHLLEDVVRGAGNGLYSDTNVAEDTYAVNHAFASFDSDGFTINSPSSTCIINGSTHDVISWLWKAGGAGVSNSDGTITATVSAAAAGNFSVVGYTGDGTAGATVGHGLPDMPEAIILKNRDASDSWLVYHEGVASDPETDYLLLDGNGALVDAANVWNDTAPTSTVFTIGNNVAVNTSGEDYVAYCFRSVPGVCKVGSYRGNGSTDGPFVWCGFKPRWVMIKRVDSTGNWLIWDTVRDPDNEVQLRLFADLADVEASGTLVLDALSVGVKPRATHADLNANGGDYIIIAMADTGQGAGLPPIPGG